MKDLDIRGAGDLLGAEQSGFINDIGFETYHKILEEALRELKSELFSEFFEERPLARGTSRDWSDDCILETDLTMLIPNSYLADTTERHAIYRDLDNVANKAELKKFRSKVTDRFGPIPAQVLDLMEAIRLRWIGEKLGLEKMVLRKGVLIGTFIANQKHSFFESETFTAILRAVQAQPRMFKVYEKAGTLRVSVQDVKNVQQAKAALEGVVGVAA